MIMKNEFDVLGEQGEEAGVNGRNGTAAKPRLRANTGDTSGDFRRLVASKLHDLPAEQRDVLVLKVQEQKTYQEIADVLGLTRDRVTQLVHSGLSSLARELQAAGILSS